MEPVLVVTISPMTGQLSTVKGGDRLEAKVSLTKK